ncbi:C4-dicarboxylate TRAP transporter substrate-binding protein [Agathobaculum sp. TL06]
MKKLIAGMLAAIMAFSLAACGGETDSNVNQGGEQSAAAEATTLKFNLVKSNTDPQYEWYGRFFDDLEAASNGEIVGEIYTTESLGPTADVIEQAALGERVVADCDLAWLANYVPDMAAIMSPYLIQKPEEIMAIWNSEVFQDMCTELEAQGLHLIALNYEGTRNLLTKKDITSRADVNGLKIRCASTTMWNAVAEMLGGNPTNIAMSETYQALSQGVADAAEGVYSVMYSNKWNEVLSHVIETEHLVGYTAIVMSSEVYNSLSDAAKAAMDETAQKYMQEFLELSGGVQDEYKQKLIDAGVQVSSIDKTEFIEAAKSIPDKFPDWTPGVYDELTAVLEEARGNK